MTYERALGTLRVNCADALRCAVLLLLAAPIVACSEDEPEQTEGELGSECDVEKPKCEEGLECTAHGKEGACTLPAGAECDVDEHENGGCADTAICEAPTPEGDAGADSVPSTCRIREGETCDPKDEFCSGNLECAELTSGEHQCHPRVALRGVVTDTSNNDGVRDAHVIGIDAEGSAATNVAISEDDGAYVLYVPVVRNDDGSPSDERFTLQAGAQDYQAFPYGVRVALPIEATDAKLVDGEWVIDNALTHVGLIRLPDGERHWISGTLEAAEDAKDGESDLSGVLIVASDGSEAHSAITDKAGDFTIFNVSDAAYEVNGYAAALQVESESVSVAGKNVEGVTLKQLLDATTDVSGNIQIVNAAGGSLTSVILVVADTFDADAARGEVPRGLRAPRTGAPDVSGDFTISDVPDGEYVVLAAYENDSLVRDPDTNISGTDFVRLTVDHSQGATATLSESFKVTQALTVFGPGADEAEAVTAAPTLSWADDSSEDWYDVRVFDALGNEVWNALEVPGVSGSEDVNLEYEGPLEPGMYYQFRVTSFRQPGKGDAAPISATEDLRGVFFQAAK